MNAQEAPQYFTNNALPPLTLIFGEEVLLNIEALSAWRKRGLQDNFSERKRVFIEKSKDWKNVIDDIQTPSLFAPSRLIEVHFDGKKLDKQAQTLIPRLKDIAHLPVKVALFFSQIEKPLETPWFKELKSQILAVQSFSLNEQSFQNEITKRLAKAHLKLDEGALHCLIRFHEGNLLGLAQAIERLGASQHEGVFSEADIRHFLEDISRFSIFDFKQAFLTGNWLECRRIALKIAEEDRNLATLLNWHLSRDMHILLQLRFASSSEQNNIFQHFRVFSRQKTLYQNALSRFSPKLIKRLIMLSAQLDRINKGSEKGDFWLTLSQFLSQLALQNHHSSHI